MDKFLHCYGSHTKRNTKLPAQYLCLHTNMAHVDEYTRKEFDSFESLSIILQGYLIIGSC